MASNLKDMESGAKLILQNFKKDLRAVPASLIAWKYLLSGGCHYLEEELYVSLKRDVADHFGVHLNEVLVVGSAKLGFSISDKEVKDDVGKAVSLPKYRPFSIDRSDIDVAIVSSQIFDRVWVDIHRYSINQSAWKSSQQGRQFKKYLFDGWLRPDKFPSGHLYKYTQEWYEFFGEISQSKKYGDIQIKGGLYKGWHFLEEYHLKAVKKCIEELS